MINATLLSDNNLQLKVLVTESVIERNKGLFSADISEIDGLWITPCNSIHTFAMKYNIDLVYLNRMNQVIKLIHNIVPWRMSFSFYAKSVIELHSGTIDDKKIKIGQTFSVH